jgi:hypothetical protein
VRKSPFNSDASKVWERPSKKCANFIGAWKFATPVGE